MAEDDTQLWAYRVIADLSKGRRVEDERVELKRSWPASPEDAARRIAGHCNAAGGGAALWLIGVDEQLGVVGADSENLENWWPQVQRCFDGPAPTLSSALVSHNEKSCTALRFNTTLAPYVVLRRDRGDEREIPWREGSRVRSARRHELMGLIAAAPWQGEVRLFDAWMFAERGRYGQGWEFFFEVRLHFRHEAGGPLNLPLALATFDVRPNETSAGSAFDIPEIWGMAMDDIGPRSTSQVVIERSGAVRVGGHGLLRSGGDLTLPMRIGVVLRTFDGNMTVHAKVPLVVYASDLDRAWIPLDQHRWLPARLPLEPSEYAPPRIPHKVTNPDLRYDNWPGVWRTNLPKN